MRTSLVLVASAALVIAATIAPQLAAAEPTVTDGAAPAHTSPYAFGVRIGGYGFRRDQGDSRNAWDECRMNGVGLFGQRTLGTSAAFVEAGLDVYFTESWPMPPAGDLPIDRTSGLLTTAIGLRGNLTDRISGYAQLGGGLELTQVSVPYGDATISDRKLMPEGFLGFGGDIRITDRTYIGSNLRFNVMGNFTYDPKQLEMQSGWTSPPAASDVFDPSPAISAQMQFYVRRDL